MSFLPLRVPRLLSRMMSCPVNFRSAAKPRATEAVPANKAHTQEMQANGVG